MPDPNDPHADKDRELTKYQFKGMAKPKSAPSSEPGRQLTLEQFDKMPWEEVWKRAIPIDREEFIRRNKPKKQG